MKTSLKVTTLAAAALLAVGTLSVADAAGHHKNSSKFSYAKVNDLKQNNNYKNQAKKNQHELTQKEAAQLALKRVPGATWSDLKDVRRDSDDGHTTYEGKIVKGDKEWEWEVDAVTGQITDWDYND